MLNDDSTITNINIDDATAEISLYSLVVANGLDRRNTLRLRYHSEHFEPLPHVKISSQFILPYDISAGGMALKEDYTPFRASVGEEIRIELSWQSQTVETLAKVVNDSQGMYRLKWAEDIPQLTEYLRTFYTPAVLGEKLYLLQNHLDDVHVEAQEIWLGPGGEALIFQEEIPDIQPSVFMSWGDRESTVFYKPFAITCKGFHLNSLELGKWILLLNQKSSPSQYILNLIDSLYPLYTALVRQEKAR